MLAHARGAVKAQRRRGDGSWEIDEIGCFDDMSTIDHKYQHGGMLTSSPTRDVKSFRAYLGVEERMLTALVAPTGVSTRSN
jgi:hypothetical protein